MSSSNLNRYTLILSVFFIAMYLFANLADLACEETIEAAEVSEEIKPENEESASRMFQIRNLSINESKEKIKALLSKDEKLGADVEGFTFLRSGEEVNFLVVTDTPAKLEQISQILEELEKEFAPVTVNLDFSDVALNQILATIAQGTGLNIIGGEELSEKINIHLKDVPLEDVFDIILRTTGYTYVKEGKILRIIPQEEAPLVTEVFELQFVHAAQMEKAISHLLTREGTVKSFSKFSEEEYSNFLIVTDTPESLATIRDLVKRLDKKVGQVMIEVKFCEVTLDKDDELGIEFLIRPYITGASTQTRFPLPMMGTKQLDRPDVLTQEAGEITLGTVSFADFTATLHALDTKTEVNLIASPRIATRDGEEAEIVIGDKIPIPLYERNEATGSMEVTGYQTEDIGVLLRVTPVINRDNTVTLKVHPEVSEITGYTGPNNERPIISTREVTTLFTVENGKTIVLGGLMKQTVTNALTKVPILGDIPIFGKLFRYQDDAEDKRELLIFITPHILEAGVSPEQITLEDN